jgi:hypothetical protein
MEPRFLDIVTESRFVQQTFRLMGSSNLCSQLRTSDLEARITLLLQKIRK